MFRILLAIVWIVVAVVATASGLEYYQTPVVERVYSDSHEFYAPTGLVGQGYGIVGTVMILAGVTLYTLRKRVRIFSGWGRLKAWLEFHIFLCTLGPFLVLLHTTFKFGGIVSIAFWSMTAVVVSGVFGRYVYVWIPKTVNGHFLTAGAIVEEQKRILRSIQTSAPIDEGRLASLFETENDASSQGLLSALMASAGYRLARRRARRRLDRRLAEAGVQTSQRPRILRLIEERQRLSQQAELLQPFQRMFRYWHAFHLPLAMVMLLILGIHVGVSVWLGYTWIF